MRTLVINRNIKAQRRPIEYLTADILPVGEDGLLPIVVTCVGKHNLPDEGALCLYYDKGFRPIEKTYNYVVRDEKSFVVYIPEYLTLQVENFGAANENALIELLEDNLHTVVKDVKNLSLRYLGEVFNGGVYISYDENRDPTNEEDAASRTIMCSRPIGFVGRGFVDIKNDWFINEDGFNTDIVFQENVLGMELSLPLTHEPSYRLNDEQAILNGYFEAVKSTIVPEIVDNEKQQFIPVIRYSNATSIIGERYKPVNEIEFNLHFRNRFDSDATNRVIREGWRTTDEQLWNGLEIRKGGDTETETDDVLRYTTNGFDDTYADELDVLGFTADDIRFSKMKVKKSFIRLMFYSSKEMLKKELLGYSTIFLDAGELYRTYNAISLKGLPIFDSGRTEDDLRLSARFSVKGKYLSEKSSEGFYLYLFPSEIEGESIPRTIYMKVEFNHAGYGKTVPMMLPRDEKGKIILATDAGFPMNFTPVVDDGNGNMLTDFDFEGYQNAILIPLEIWFDKRLKQYVYHFPFADDNDGKIVLNLFEPRIKGIS